MKKRIYLLVMLVILSLTLLLPSALAIAPPRPLIQMAILLDTSNSMDGLINQAKSQIWDIVNDLATCNRNGLRPRLEIAIFEYGKNSIPAGEGFLRMVLPLTTDLDEISAKLFELQTNGGSEYCGQVIQSAVRGLRWSPRPSDYKLIVIAGNEPFTQGDIDYRLSCSQALEKGIVVNTIFCGNHYEGVTTKWEHGALLTEGSYLNIDQDEIIDRIDAPQDPEILKLNDLMNQTYLPYGKKGQFSKALQEKQDSNACSVAKETQVKRSLFKASGLYSNSGWDLVDAVKSDGPQALDRVNSADLPKAMQKMTKIQRQKYVTAKLKEREAIQARLNQLNQERRQYVAQQRAKQAGGPQNTLDVALLKAIRKQASQKGFRFK